MEIADISNISAGDLLSFDLTLHSLQQTIKGLPYRHSWPIQWQWAMKMLNAYKNIMEQRR